MTGVWNDLFQTTYMLHNPRIYYEALLFQSRNCQKWTHGDLIRIYYVKRPLFFKIVQII